MKILAIETSADETAVALLEETQTGYNILGEELYSQARQHADYGGIYPTLAKREHQKNLVPLTKEALKQAGLYEEKNEPTMINHSGLEDLRDEEFTETVQEFLSKAKTPDIDYIAVTVGPGLEPALWAGVTFAKALSRVWNIPTIGVNHMEGHIFSSLVKKNQDNILILGEIQFPLLALLISGGHTELVVMKDWFQYELVGRTRDDAVGEAFDKVARMLGLPYPGGPEIDTYAERARARGVKNALDLPRPMLNEPSCDFSFSGLKTAVLYLLKELGELTEELKEDIALEFEDAVRDVLVTKTRRALEKTGAKSLVVGGGVSANRHIRAGLEELLQSHPGTELYYPGKGLTGDNAVMIAVAAAMRVKHGHIENKPIEANGSQSLTTI